MQQVDRLGQIRLEIKRLRQEARMIRERMIAGDIPLTGDRYVATLRRQVMLRTVPDSRTPWSPQSQQVQQAHAGLQNQPGLQQFNLMNHD